MRRLGIVVWLVSLLGASAAYAAVSPAASLAAGVADLSLAAWGSSKAQVRAAYPKAEEALGSDGKPLRSMKIEGPVTLAGRTWSGVTFRFDTKEGLERLELSVDQSQLASVNDWLASSFGPPRDLRGQLGPSGRTSRLFTAVYRHAATRDQIKLQSMDFFGTDLSTLTIKREDPAEQARIARVERLRELQAAGVAKATGWEKTRWHMTRDELKAAYPAAEPNDIGNVLLAGPIVWQGRSWLLADFNFELDIGLVDVMLRAPAPDVAAIDADMRRLHGAPVKVVGTLGEPVYSAWYKLPEIGAWAEVFHMQIGDQEGSGVSFRAIED